MVPAALAQEVPAVPALERVQERTLANGLRVLVERDARQPRVAVVVSYEVGHRDDPPGYRELAHLVEHMTFRGSLHLKPGEVMRRIHAAGGLNGAYTSLDHTTYFSVLPAKDLPLALWIESERLAFTTGSMTEQQLDNELEVLRSEWLERGAERIGASIPSFQMHALFPEGHAYRHVADVGDRHDFSFDLDHVRWFHQKHYRPERATLAIVGDIDPVEANALVDRYFGDVRGAGTAAPRVPAPVELFASEQVLDLSWRYDRPALIARYRVACPDLACEQALRLLNERATGGRGAVLTYALRSDTEIASGVGTEIVAFGNMRDVIVAVDLEPEVEVEQAQVVLDDLLDQLSRLAVDEKELAALKQMVWVSEVRALEEPLWRAQRYAESGRGAGERYDVAAAHRALFGISSAQLEQVAREVFDTRRRLLTRISVDENAAQEGSIDDSTGSLYEGGAR